MVNACDPSLFHRPFDAVRVTSLDGLVLTVEPTPTEHETAGQRAPAEEGGTTV